MNKSRRKQILVTKELSTKPGPLVQKRILKNSISNDFENARTEWELVDHIPSDSKDFVENCQLCNHKNYKENWLIRNQQTNTSLKVGSDCITRFIQFAGTASQADSNLYFNQRKKEILIEESIKLLFREVIQSTLPLARQANKLKKSLSDLLEVKGKKNLLNSNEGQKEILLNILKISNLTTKDFNNFADLLKNELPVQRETKHYRQFKYIEGSTLNKKRSKVTNNTLSRSQSFNNPERKYN
ncbi:hypothetical protein ACOQFO_08305 [Ureibacillus sp. MALMAid1270]|uniref:hypothetical protein n=1 Tax=Ureibacillus sp. MALMAid1270 TaxID=3411629 RepID=UPI003BA426B4